MFQPCMYEKYCIAFIIMHIHFMWYEIYKKEVSCNTTYCGNIVNVLIKINMIYKRAARYY